MNHKKWISSLTKVMYAFGLVFLLSGMLLSIVSFPAQAQEATPQPELQTPEEKQGKTKTSSTTSVPVTVVLKQADCEQLVFTVSGTKEEYQGFPLHFFTSAASAPYVASLEPAKKDITHVGTTWQVEVTVVLTPAWSSTQAGSAAVTLQAEARGWDENQQEWTAIGSGQAAASNEQCGYTGEAQLLLAPECPDYSTGLNVWRLTNAGSAAVDYDCVGCSTAGPGTIGAGESVQLTGVRLDGTETITVNYGQGQTAFGDNSGVTDQEALSKGCNVPGPVLDVVFGAVTEGCDVVEVEVYIDNIGDALAEDVVISYSLSGAAVDGDPMPLNTYAGDIPAGERAGPFYVTIPAAWTTTDPNESITLTAEGLIDDNVYCRRFITVFNPGACTQPDLSVMVNTLGEGCDSATFQVSVTNNGEGPAEGVVVDLNASGSNISGTPDPLSINVGALAPGASAGPYTVTVPLDWGNSQDFNLFVALNADVSAGGVLQDSASAQAYNQQQCYSPGPVISLSAEDQTDCSIEAGEVCVTFYLSISNLPQGSVVTLGEQEFNTDGEYEVQICGTWPGVGMGFDPVELVLSGEALLDGEPAASHAARVFYDPETAECNLPVVELLLIDPFCYETSEGYKAAWQVVNPNDFSVDFAWQLNGGELQAASAPANDLVWLGNLDLDVTHTVAVFWGVDGFAELSQRISSDGCSAPTPPPPPPPPPPSSPPSSSVQTSGTPVPVQVAALEQPAPVVESAVLIPVTGVDLEVFGLGFLEELLINLGLIFVGLAFVTNSISKKG